MALLEEEFSDSNNRITIIFILYFLDSCCRHRNYHKSYNDDSSRDRDNYSKDRRSDYYGSGHGHRSRSRSYSPRKLIIEVISCHV